MPDQRNERTAAYFTDRCGVAVEFARDSWAPCGLKLGHEGAHEPIKVGKQTTSESPAAQDRYKRLIGDLYSAEEAARRCERERNEGDADAIRRDAIRSALKLGFTDGSLPPFADLWERHE